MRETQSLLFKNSIFCIWHEDPCKNGDYDSCGWFFPKLNHEEKTFIGIFKIQFEAEKKWRNYSKSNPTNADAFVATCNIFERFKYKLNHGKYLSNKEINYILQITSDPCDSITPLFEEDSTVDLISILFNHYKKMRRKWWQHPKYHFWHWKIIIYLIDDFKRWAFSRCQCCGKRFKWKEPAIASCLGVDDRPKWFKSENYVYHEKCCGYYGEEEE